MPAFAVPGLCTWPNVGDTLSLLLTVTDPGPGPCALGCARALSSNSRLMPRETGVGVLVRGGCADGCVGVGATGVEGTGVPTESGTTDPWAFASFLSSFCKRGKEAYQLGRSEMNRNLGTHPLLPVFACLRRLGDEGMNIPLKQFWNESQHGSMRSQEICLNVHP
jgi:hypothetical protein